MTTFVLDSDEASIRWTDGAIDGFPAEAVLDAEHAIVAREAEGATPTGPFFARGTPEAAFLALRRLWPTAVAFDAPVFEAQPDELEAPH